jgi:cyclophilin family peptidyl-prolyl cis-trans isomerase
MKRFCFVAAMLVLASCSGKPAESQPAKAAMFAAPEAGNGPAQFVIQTQYGDITIELYDDTPLHRDNFAKLASEKFFDGTTFHCVIPGFMIQGGDPNSKDANARETHGMGSPGYTVPAEIKHDNVRGSIAAARLGDGVNPTRASSGSQFYINVNDNAMLNGSYTVFGKVISGMEVADKIVTLRRDFRDNPIERVEMKIRAK